MVHTHTAGVVQRAASMPAVGGGAPSAPGPDDFLAVVAHPGTAMSGIVPGRVMWVSWCFGDNSVGLELGMMGDVPAPWCLMASLVVAAAVAVVVVVAWSMENSVVALSGVEVVVVAPWLPACVEVCYHPVLA